MLWQVDVSVELKKLEQWQQWQLIVDKFVPAKNLAFTSALWQAVDQFEGGYDTSVTPKKGRDYHEKKKLCRRSKISAIVSENMLKQQHSLLEQTTK